ncbi:2Fe-2S iron-sulfur cluster-binding protein [Pseudonocardia phyllosphaerae]|uniref:2Fe-2S iron-sulfur cluster-binding protein n=1 Tax=Pseudonocardia phyllosphaerae TaxID=3390502 RepID=UPI00397E6AEE
MSTDEPFEVECATSGTTVTVGAGESILTAVENAGLSPDWSCRRGECGACEVPLLAGRAEHRDSILDDEERAANTAIFPCVSRAEHGCPRLVLGL